MDKKMNILYFYKMKIIFTLIVALFFASGCVLPVVEIYAPPRSKESIQARWEAYRPCYQGTPYLVTPSGTAPYSTGTVHPEFLMDGINMANFCRYLAWLPDDLVFDSALLNKAQHGAVLLSASTFSHTPPQPADMPADFYSIGYSSTSSSNIAAGFGTLYSSIRDGYMSDADSGNIDRVGHRRWILNPKMQKTAFGFCNSYSNMQVFDGSRTETVNYDFISWPGRGFFPVQMFKGWDPWSVTLNPADYETPLLSEVQVKMTDLTSGKTWNFSQADTNTSGKYFNVNTGGYGIANCIIFRPADISAYQDNDIYEITVSGLHKKTISTPVTLKFTVYFFQLKQDS
jgi:hypothetical protein